MAIRCPRPGDRRYHGRAFPRRSKIRSPGARLRSRHSWIADDRTRARFKTRMYPEFLLPFRARSVFLDEKESLWVQRNVTGGDSAEVDLFDRQSVYLGTIRFAPGTILRRVRDGRVLATHIDDEFRTTIAEYRLVNP